MAQKATVCKAMLQIADIDRGLYADHALTVARHPSETDERMMVRLLAFALSVPGDARDGALEFADLVRVFAYAGSAAMWWAGLGGRIARAGNVEAWRIAPEASRELAGLASRSMQLQVNRHDGAVFVSDAERTVQLALERLEGR